MPVSVKVGGAWKTATAVFNKVGGVWKTAADMPVKVGGVWKTGILASGAFESIATATGTGSSGTITFSSIPSTYKSLQLRFNSVTADVIFFQFNGDTGTNYTFHNVTGSNGTIYTGGGTANNYVYSNAGWYGSNGTAPEVGIMDINDYAISTKNKTVRIFTGTDRNVATTGQVSLVSSLWLNTAAITSIKVYTQSSTNFASGTTFALYGVK